MSERPVKPSTRPHCYICGAVEPDVRLTGDHIPPEGFFMPGQKQNLFKAPLCEPCHRPLSLDDEAMRYWLTCSMFCSESGKWLHKNVVLPALQTKKKAKFYEQIKRHSIPRVIEGKGVAIENHIPSARAIPFMRRLTKGFLYLLHPDYDYSSDDFHCTLTSIEAHGKILDTLKCEIRGRETFEVWHTVTKPTMESDVPPLGFWVYRFYHDTCFTVIHSAGRDIESEYPPGYEEHCKLPKHL